MQDAVLKDDQQVVCVENRLGDDCLDGMTPKATA